jgi:hypothetical protein
MPIPKSKQKPPTCVACRGTGRSSNNTRCRPCDGTGVQGAGRDDKVVKKCSVCRSSNPVVANGMCGPCLTGEADTGPGGDEELTGGLWQ